MKINRVKDVEIKRNRRTFEINSYVNDQHHTQERRFERQRINRINQNNQLSSKSLFDDKQINYFFRSWHETKIFFRSSLSNWNNRLCHETQVNHEMKKANSQIVFRRVRKIRKKSHLSNAASQRNHLSSLVRHLNQRKARRIINCLNLIDKKISHRISYIFDEKTSSEVEFRDHSHFFVSIQSINCRCFILFDSLNSES
jgi:hypothetical protein